VPPQEFLQELYQRRAERARHSSTVR
jgi:hypothetical protein